MLKSSLPHPIDSSDYVTLLHILIIDILRLIYARLFHYYSLFTMIIHNVINTLFEYNTSIHQCITVILSISLQI